MHSSKKGNQWYFGMKAHIGVDAYSGLARTVQSTVDNVHDIKEGNSMLHGKESMVFADAGYQVINERAMYLARFSYKKSTYAGRMRKYLMNPIATAFATVTGNAGSAASAYKRPSALGVAKISLLQASFTNLLFNFSLESPLCRRVRNDWLH